MLLGFPLAVALACGPTTASSLAAAPGVSIGGEVPSYLALSLQEPNGFESFPTSGEAKNYTLKIEAQATSSVANAQLSIAAAGEGGAQRGYLSSSGSALREPLLAGSGPRLTPLVSAFGVSLASWSDPISNEAVSVRLRQHVDGGTHAGAYRATLYLTLSAQTP